MTEKFRVAVVTVLDVEAADESDAANVAEGAVMHALQRVDATPSVADPYTVEWAHVNGHEYSATVTHLPRELKRALQENYIHVTVK